MRCVVIELRETEIGALISKRFLKSDIRNDKSAIADAVYVHFHRELTSQIGQGHQGELGASDAVLIQAD
jgi:hypothetical protein